MRARVNDAVHVQIQVIELFAIGVGPGAIHRNNGAIVQGNRLVLDHWGDNLGVFGGKPPEGRGNTHLVEDNENGVRAMIPPPDTAAYLKLKSDVAGAGFVSEQKSSKNDSWTQTNGIKRCEGEQAWGLLVVDGKWAIQCRRRQCCATLGDGRPQLNATRCRSPTDQASFDERLSVLEWRAL